MGLYKFQTQWEVPLSINYFYHIFVVYLKENSDCHIYFHVTSV